MSRVKFMANKKISLAILAIIIVMLGILINKFYVKQTTQTTNDAYIRADISRISPQIAGVITEVRVHDNQWVKQGELLAVIDPREFSVALSQATAQEQSARAKQDDAKANLTRQYSLIAAAQAQLQAAQAELKFARQEQVRYQKIAASGAGSQQAAQ
ncbi:HlyD family secretion protein [Providencia manganoxydans]